MRLLIRHCPLDEPPETLRARVSLIIPRTAISVRKAAAHSLNGSLVRATIHRHTSGTSSYISMVLSGACFLTRHLTNRHSSSSEVERLLSIYGENNSFWFYASNLLDAAAALANDWTNVQIVGPERKPQEMPLRLRGALGSLVQEGKPITADWALAWYLAAPAYGLRTPAKRCFPEFLTLFEQRFAAAYPNGLLVSPPRRRLSARYRAASGAFTVDLKGEFEKLPDVVALTTPLAKIDQIAIACTSALDPYSRLVGRDPAAGETVTAQLTLPEELLRNPKSRQRHRSPESTN